MTALMELVDAHCWFPMRRRLRGPREFVHAVDGVSLTLNPHEVVGIVGESGSGKTTLGRLLLRLLSPTAGDMRFKGQTLAGLSGAEMAGYRRAVQAVFQDPYSSFNPRMRISDVVAEPLLVRGTPQRQAYERAVQVLEQVGLSAQAMTLFPHEFSGGQRQRIAIARALSCSPELIVLDEPVASLDVSIRGQVINLLSDLREQLGVGYLLISHDLGTTRFLSDRIFVMYAGQIVEFGSAAQVYDRPRHPYSRALLAAARPTVDTIGEAVPVIQGEPPNPKDPPPGCRFHPRCPWAMAGCVTVAPSMQGTGDGQVACHLFTGQLSRDQREPLPGRLPRETFNLQEAAGSHDKPKTGAQERTH